MRLSEFEAGTILVDGDGMVLPHGSIKKLIGRKLSWEDEPVELKEN